jgi:plastocyanin
MIAGAKPMHIRIALLGLLTLLATGAVPAAELKGSLKLFASGQPLRAAEAAEAIIYFRPKTPMTLPTPGEPATMVTRRKQFVPRVLAITAGNSVRFPNEDPILHNAFSTSPENAFDTGQYGRGEGKIQLFDKPGLVRVYCNVHHSMFGFILVLDTPFHTRSDAAGKFLLTGLPEGEGELVVFHDRGTPLKQSVVIGKNSTIDLKLDLNKRRVPAHTNKFGKPYSRTPNANY